ncbi:LLM class flavin-dependent oxidoreductase [Kribbella sp. NPDC050820]|uniref:LLM class flavin-dependent oxidoreductase n=1 Tax=Kribbella sp. NPDC050820 TaxID=3155408 RepID=UPI0033FBCE04
MPIRLHWFVPSHGDGRAAGRPVPGRRPAAADRRRDPDFDYLVEVARAADRLGFDGALVPFGLFCEDPWLVAAALSQETRRLRLMVAFRTGLMSPTLLAQMAATLQRMSNGRLLLNVVAGGDLEEQRRYGDHLEHDERYDRADEALQVMTGAWTGKVDVHGRYVNVEGATVVRRPDPLPRIYVGGSSPAAHRLARRYADVLLSWAERPSDHRAIVDGFDTAERDISFGTRFHVITRDRSADAWAETERFLAAVDPALIERTQQRLAQSDSHGQQRNLALHNGDLRNLEIHPGVWAGQGLTRQGSGLTLVGSHTEVADRIEEYHDCGVTEFILSGQPHLEEAYWFAEGVLPILRARGLLPAEPAGVGTEGGGG